MRRVLARDLVSLGLHGAALTALRLGMHRAFSLFARLGIVVELSALRTRLRRAERDRSWEDVQDALDEFERVQGEAAALGIAT